MSMSYKPNTVKKYIFCSSINNVLPVNEPVVTAHGNAIFVVKLNQPIRPVRIRLLNFNTFMNQFIIGLNSTDGNLDGILNVREDVGPDFQCIIPKGNYDPNTLASALQAELNANSPNLYTYTVTPDIPNFKFTISSTGLFQLRWSLGVAPPILYSHLGFLKTNETSAVDTPLALSITTPYTWSLINPPSVIFITLYPLPSSYVSSNAIIPNFVITNPVLVGDLLNWNVFTNYPQEIYLPNKPQLDTINIKVSDQDGKTLFLFTHPVNILLEVEDITH